MKLLRFLIVSLLFSTLTLQAQDDALYNFCTEVYLDTARTDTVILPPGMTARAVAFRPEIGKYWPNGRNLKVRFLGGSEAARSRVRKYAAEWSKVANIRFLFVEKGEADLRVGFTPNMGTWSLIGTDAGAMPQHKPTMNFAWRNNISESDCRATILHEFGHALGLLHEHQHPKGGIPWDKVKLYRFYRETQGWDEDMVDQQVLGRYNAGKTQYTRYDPQSIMHYPISNALTLGDFEVGMNKELSPIDRAFIAKVYPKTNAATPVKPSQPAVVATATLSIRDVLPESQKREQVWITIEGVTKTFVLEQNSVRGARVSFTLPKDDTYAYEIRTKTTFLRRTNGYIQEKTLYGYGKGEVFLQRNAAFDLAIGKALNEQWFEVKLVATPTEKN